MHHRSACDSAAGIFKINKKGETVLDITHRVWRKTRPSVVEYVEAVFEQRSRQ